MDVKDNEPNVFLVSGLNSECLDYIHVQVLNKSFFYYPQPVQCLFVLRLVRLEV